MFIFDFPRQIGLLQMLNELFKQPFYTIVAVLSLLVGGLVILVSVADIKISRIKFVGEPSAWQKKAFPLIGIFIITVGLSVSTLLYIDGIDEPPNQGDGETSLNESSPKTPAEFRIENVEIVPQIISDESGQSTPIGNGTVIHRQCPVDLIIEADIEATGTSERLIYQWTRDNQTLDSRQLSFNKTARRVYHNETLGKQDAYESHVYRIRILSPVEYSSRNKSSIAVNCTNRGRRTLVIEGTGGGTGTWYTVEVSGEIEPVNETINGVPVTDDPNATVNKSRVDGWVAGGADGYRFTGNITGFSLTDHGEAAVYVDGEETDSRRLGDRNPIPRTLIIEGSGEWTEYSFRVSGELNQVDGSLEGINVSDDGSESIDGSEVTGAAAGLADGFRFSGEVIDFSVESPGEVTVYVDGQARDVETLSSKSLPRTLVLDADPSKPDSDYAVGVSGRIKQVEGTVDGVPVSKNSNDIVESPNVDGYVAAGADGFRFSGELTEFSLDEADAATVYVDGRSRDLNALPPQVTASFNATPSDPVPNKLVTFDGSASKAPSESIARYEWEIRRGELSEGPVVKSGTGKVFSTRFESPGTYTIRLFIITENGTTASDAQSLQVNSESGTPTASIDFPSETMQLGERVYPVQLPR